MAAATTASRATLRTLRSSTICSGRVAHTSSRKYVAVSSQNYFQQHALLPSSVHAQTIRPLSTHPFVLSHPSTVEKGADENTRGRIVCITSGKGGVGKTTSAASFATGLAMRGLKTCVVDFDIGLRNLDIHLGVEVSVAFYFYLV